jgi:hypothetical protein
VNAWNFKTNPPSRTAVIWLENARVCHQRRFPGYNNDHRHGGAGSMAPAAVHHGTAAALNEQCAIMLDAAFAAHPAPTDSRSSAISSTILLFDIDRNQSGRLAICL